MNIEAMKLEVLQLVINTREEDLLRKIKDLYEGESDWWTTLNAEERKEIEEGLRQSEKGDVVSHEMVMRKFEQWK